MSDTPMTDSATLRDGDWVSADFARDLERELADWKAYAERLEQAGDAMSAWNLHPRNLGGDASLAYDWDQAKETKP